MNLDILRCVLLAGRTSGMLQQSSPALAFQLVGSGDPLVPANVDLDGRGDDSEVAGLGPYATRKKILEMTGELPVSEVNDYRYTFSPRNRQNKLCQYSILL